MTRDIPRHSEVWKTEESVCVAIASESELALRRSRLLFFLVGVHVILSFLIEKKRKNNGYEMVNIDNTLALFHNKTLKQADFV